MKKQAYASAKRSLKIGRVLPGYLRYRDFRAWKSIVTNKEWPQFRMYYRRKPTGKFANIDGYENKPVLQTWRFSQNADDKIFRGSNSNPLPSGHNPETILNTYHIAKVKY